MAKFIALLRGINVSGKNKIRMVELQSVFDKLELLNPVTYLQSGNIVFESSPKLNHETTANTIESAIQKTFGHDVAVLVISGKDINQIFNNNPFIINEQTDTSACYVTFLYEKPGQEYLNALKSPEKETGRFKVVSLTVYVHCPNGYGRTKINNQFFERKLKVPATTRNWKTVTALNELSTNAI
ncbi:MAG: DUF1697 domain-containing protein [Verrucomicrobia bacterium]|nr:DUF1697 domain-containing protein [Verrucomicrobiota bacterium]